MSSKTINHAHKGVVTEEKEYVVYRTPLGTILIDWDDCLWEYGYPSFSKRYCKEIARGYSEGGTALAALYAKFKVLYEKPHTKEEAAEKYELWKRMNALGIPWQEEPFALNANTSEIPTTIEK